MRHAAATSGFRQTDDLATLVDGLMELGSAAMKRALEGPVAQSASY